MAKVKLFPYRSGNDLLFRGKIGSDTKVTKFFPVRGPEGSLLLRGKDSSNKAIYGWPYREGPNLMARTIATVVNLTCLEYFNSCANLPIHVTATLSGGTGEIGSAFNGTFLCSNTGEEGSCFYSYYGPLVGFACQGNSVGYRLAVRVSYETGPNNLTDSRVNLMQGVSFIAGCTYPLDNRELVDCVSPVGLAYHRGASFGSLPCANQVYPPNFSVSA